MEQSAPAGRPKVEGTSQNHICRPNDLSLVLSVPDLRAVATLQRNHSVQF